MSTFLAIMFLNQFHNYANHIVKKSRRERVQLDEN